MSDETLTNFHKRPGYVYFAGMAEIGLVKIGHSISPANRVVGLFSWCPWHLELLAHVPGTVLDERRVHAAFMGSHFRGEWFRSTPDLLALIDQLKATGELPAHLRSTKWEPCPTSRVTPETRAKRSATLRETYRLRRETGNPLISAWHVRNGIRA